MARNLTNLFISESFQYLVQKSGSELQDGIGNTISGSLLITASLADTATTASYVLNAVSSSFATNAANAVSSSYAVTASHLTGTITSASYAVTSTSASHAVNADSAISANNATTANFATSAATASLATTAVSSSYATNATSASYATTSTTASYANTATSSSYALTASFALNGGGGGSVDTGSLLTTASISDAEITFTKGDASTFAIEVNNVSASISASYAVTASHLLGTITSASYAVSSSHAQIADTASYFAGTVTSASYAVSSSQAANAISASLSQNTRNAYVNVSAANVDYHVTFNTINAGYKELLQETEGAQFTYNPSNNKLTVENIAATTLSGSLSGNATTATSASYATTATSASHALNSDSAISSSYALTASYAANASTPTLQQVTDTGNSTTNAITASDFYTTGTITATSASIQHLLVVYETSSVIYSSGSNQFGDASNDVQTLYGTVDIKTGPVLVTGSVTATSFTGSLLGTASFADNATSASFATTASYVASVVSASYATTATSASHAVNADSSISSSYALTASFALNAGDPFPYAGTGSIAYFETNGQPTAEFINSNQLNVGIINGDDFDFHLKGRNLATSIVLSDPNIDYSGSTHNFQNAVVISGSLNVSSSITANNVITNQTDTYTGSAKIHEIVTLNQTEYNAISASAQANTMYVVTNATASIPTLSGNNVFTGDQTFSGSVSGWVNSIAIVSNSGSVDFTLGNFYTLTLAASTTYHLTPTNITPGTTVNLKVTQASGGSGSISFPSSVKQVTPYTASAGGNSVDVISLIAFDTGSVYVNSVQNLV